MWSRISQNVDQVRYGEVEQYPPLLQQTSRVRVLLAHESERTSGTADEFVRGLTETLADRIVKSEAPTILPSQGRNEIDSKRQTDGSGQSVERAKRRCLPARLIGGDGWLRRGPELSQSGLGYSRACP